MALPLYALTLFISAFILFLVQPIIGKILLPKLGGTPQVWNTCMVFFQMVLLAGYAYTHTISTRLKLRQQLIVHALLLFLPLIILLPFPFSFMGRDSGHSIWDYVPPLGSNPIATTLGILFTYVALPFFVVATSAPLLQKWFVHTGHPAAKDPYFLYGASNFGSMLSLILYPFLIEPFLGLSMQGWTYADGYFVLIGFVIICAVMVWGARETIIHKPRLEPELALAGAGAQQTGIAAGAPSAGPSTAIKTGPPAKTPARPAMGSDVSHPAAADEMTFGRRFRWVMLAAVPSSLMLGITTHITTDLSPMPVFWLVPLTLYIFSFILVFARWPVVWTDQPHTFMLYAQPFCVALMILTNVFNLTSDTSFMVFAILAHVLAFFTTALVCHGELAKDRPSTKHLTEFYLLMSVGGALGGVFNALLAPVLFPKLWEFPLAVFAAGLVRPRMFDTGLGDNLLAGVLETPQSAPAPKPAPKGGKGHHPHHHHQAPAGASESLVGILDWAWPVGIAVVCAALIFIAPMFSSQGTTRGMIIVNGIAFGIPLLLCCACMARPMRIGLGIGAVLLIHMIYQNSQDQHSIYSTRSYFGTISVKDGVFGAQVNGKDYPIRYTQLVHGHINHGMNFEVPKDKKDRGNVEKDLSRLATTYYHREGPEGRVMEKFNWFPGPPNTYWGDARIGASLVGNGIAELGVGAFPLTECFTAWSDPPYATIGLGTGTMASYGRPYQHVHFYEIDNQILRLSLLKPTREIRNYPDYEKFKETSSRETFFNYLERAIQRGATVQVLMGDARLRMALPYANHYTDEAHRGGGPNNFYHMMVVDAFSSDAIPAHLLTREAFELYFQKLTEEGILCVHTSNRFVDLPKVVAAVTDSLNYRCLRGHDANDSHASGHYTSEWVMVARKMEYLKGLTEDVDFLTRYQDSMRAKNPNHSVEAYWTRPEIFSRYVWTDDYYNLMSVVRFR